MPEGGFAAPKAVNDNNVTVVRFRTKAPFFEKNWLLNG
jgi:hypothetical protein